MDIKKNVSRSRSSKSSSGKLDTTRTAKPKNAPIKSLSTPLLTADVAPETHASLNTAIVALHEFVQEQVIQSGIQLPVFGDKPTVHLEKSTHPITLHIEYTEKTDKGIVIAGNLHDPENCVTGLGILVDAGKKTYIPLDSSFPGVKMERAIEHFSAFMPISVQNNVPFLVLTESEVLLKQLEIIGENQPTVVLAENIMGSFDKCEPVAGLHGWVVNTLAVDEPLEIEVFADGLSVARAIAGLFRPDLWAAGIGKGNNGFIIMPPTILFDGVEHLIEVREASSQFLLPGSPRIFRASSLMDDLEASSYQNDQSDVSKIVFDLFIGCIAHGWSYLDSEQKEQPVIKVVFGEKTIGKFKANSLRQDVKENLGIKTGNIGFDVMLGGVLHFSAIVNHLTHVDFKQISQDGKAVRVDLRNYYSEAYTFAPLKSFSRSLAFLSPGAIKGARCLDNTRFSLLLEVVETPINGKNKIQLDFYQEDEFSKLKIVGQFDVELAGQLVNIEFDLVSKERPILLVVTDGSGNILLTDCIPSPVIFMARYEPLIEYHSLLANGQPSFDVAAKLSRGFLDFQLTTAMGVDIKNIDGQPHEKNTAVLLFVRENFDAFASFDAQYYQHISNHIAFLDRNGLVRKKGSNIGSSTIQQFLAESEAEFFLLCEINNVIRPDFWAVIDGQRYRLTHKPGLIYFDSIWLEGASRPYWVKNNLLCHEEFSNHTLAPVNAIMVARELLSESISLRPETFRSGCFRPENAFNFASTETITHFPVVVDINRLQLLPQVTQRFINAQIPLPDIRLLAADNFSKTIANREISTNIGVSIVINYRNSVEVTIRCLQSIRLQCFDGPLELILVNNGSTSWYMQSVINTAIQLFGESNIKTLDYNKGFNHSAQCNRAVQLASHDYILMLSNDAILISQDAIARSLKIASVSWIGTCGFRIVAIEKEQCVLKSFGLKLSSGRYLLTGACPLATNKPPAFTLEYTVGTSGNTFAAVMIRKAVYEEAGGLDEAVFPTDYNDVDFCVRTAGLGYRHVIIGSVLIGHSGRGSREMNLDLPINQRIIERLPLLSTLVDNFDILSF
jgi:GT2 family glycosyltransferase